MTVAELIKFLEQQPQDMLVAYRIHSEYNLLEEYLIKTKRLCEPKPDGWVQEFRKVKPSQEYLVFPGN